jgi:hypothetical protein
MKYFSHKIIFLLICFAGFSKADSTYLSPSVYYTNGSYSEGRVSNSISFYNVLQLSGNFYLINHYDHLEVKSSEWNYMQQTFLGGLFIDVFPLLMKFNYAHYKGDYNHIPFHYKYSDFTNLFSTDVFYYTDEFYLGAAYMHLNETGYKKQITDQVTLRFEKILSYHFFISFKPSYSRLLDGRNLFSAALKSHYLVNPDLLLKFGGFGGERAYYFDTDLLTIFNQDDTQRYQLFAQAEYSFFKELTIILSYQHTKFTAFEINYLVAGLKANLYL